MEISLNVVLDVSLRLKALLEKGSDLEVILTRQNDTFLSLEEREEETPR